MPVPKEKHNKILCVDDLRHAEYYQMQKSFDELYSKSKNNEIFTDLMELILARENILLAYRNIKTNQGSKTAGTDGLTINDIGKLSPEDVVYKVNYILCGSPHGYRPKPVRRKDIPKPNGSLRPLGIPCIWDRLIQQCIKQVMEPICEAKFSDNSYGFRPMRSVENAISKVQNLMHLSNLHYVVEFDIKGFFDNVNHSKLIRQIWAMGIRDTRLIYIIRQILKAPIRMPDGSTIIPIKGTPQGGIISPLLANIVLNELDHWIESQWQENPIALKHIRDRGIKGMDKSNGYTIMKKTNLKEMFEVRYADDFRVFCRTKSTAEKVKIAITQWLSERLRLEISQEKTRVVNLKRHYSEFLGFKIKVKPKGKEYGRNRYVVSSYMCDKALKNAKQKLVKQAKQIAKPVGNRREDIEISTYNSMVLGIQNYYRIAMGINHDCRVLHRAVMTVFTNRLLGGNRLTKDRNKGRKLTKTELERFGKSSMLRFSKSCGLPIYPIGYVQHKNPMGKKRTDNPYTPEGRSGKHNNLQINTHLMQDIMLQPQYGKSVEYADNRISLFSAQWGKCAVTGKSFEILEDIHCHHKKPKCDGGTDKYANLVLILKPVHRLIHATAEETIQKYLTLLNLNNTQIQKVNKLRELAGNEPIK
ncbi:MAG TPA: group II intron reverse transcriptase/maturase [Clostridiales bacterium]|nr:group II intron reverse transcriptase/maturase [Clostridiales bacterium]